MSTYWIKTTSPEHAAVDRTFTRLEDRLNALGYQMGGELTYVEEQNDVAANRTITTTIAVFGLLIVAISMSPDSRDRLPPAPHGRRSIAYSGNDRSRFAAQQRLPLARVR